MPGKLMGSSRERRERQVDWGWQLDPRRPDDGAPAWSREREKRKSGGRRERIGEKERRKREGKWFGPLPPNRTNTSN